MTWCDMVSSFVSVSPAADDSAADTTEGHEEEQTDTDDPEQEGYQSKQHRKQATMEARIFFSFFTDEFNFQDCFIITRPNWVICELYADSATRTRSSVLLCSLILESCRIK